MIEFSGFDAPRIEVDETLGFGCAWIDPRPNHFAVLPVAYGEGYLRCLRRRSRIRIERRSPPGMGRECMEIMKDDQSDISREVIGGDVVSIEGRVDDRIGLRQRAQPGETIHREFHGRRLQLRPRVVV